MANKLDKVEGEELPANTVLTRVGARKWLACIMVAWGLCSACTAFVTDATTFV